MELKPRYEIRMLPPRQGGGSAERWLTRDNGVPLLRLETSGQISQISDGEAMALARRICRLLNADEVVQTPGHYSAEEPEVAPPQAGYVLHYFRKRGEGPVEKLKFSDDHGSAFVPGSGVPHDWARRLIAQWNDLGQRNGLVYTLEEESDGKA